MPQRQPRLKLQTGRQTITLLIMNDSDFDDLLRSARGENPLPRTFRQSVWRRIESDAALKAAPWYSRALALVARPWAAATGLAATVALGFILGNITAPEDRPTAATYAYSISPFAQTHH